MKFGKLSAIENIDFSLPSDASFNQVLFEEIRQGEASFKFYIGCTGWSMKEWVGKVYPSGAKAKDFLYHYSRQFNTIELNTTHYRIPGESLIEKWYKESAADFHFCPKIPQVISHSRDLGLGGGQIAVFCQAIAGLKEKLGCCFMQLPPHFAFNRLPQLENFLRAFPAQIPLAVELRHESWFALPGRLNEWLRVLRRYGKQAVLTDVAGRRDVLHMGLSGDRAMIRFVGNDLHPTDYERIDAWVERLYSWYVQGLRSVYFFTHEPDNIKAPELAAYLWDQLKKYADIETRGPNLKELPGEQMQLF